MRTNQRDGKLTSVTALKPPCSTNPRIDPTLGRGKHKSRQEHSEAVSHGTVHFDAFGDFSKIYQYFLLD